MGYKHKNLKAMLKPLKVTQVHNRSIINTAQYCMRVNDPGFICKPNLKGTYHISLKNTIGLYTIAQGVQAHGILQYCQTQIDGEVENDATKTLPGKLLLYFDVWGGGTCQQSFV